MTMMSEVKQRARITVLGPKSAGKTALVFRYMARLFVCADSRKDEGSGITNDSNNKTACSHSGGLDNLYYHCVCLDNILYDLEILDLAQSKNALKFERCSDAFIIVYSVASRSDFEEAAQLFNSLRSNCPRKPVLFVGNKTDLARQVTTNEGRQIGGSLFAEVSTAHIGSWEVHQAIYQLLRRLTEMAADQTPSNNIKCHLAIKNQRFGRRETMDTSSA